MPTGDKYDARGFAVGVCIFLAIGVGIGIVDHAGIAAWLSGLAVGAGAMNVTSFILRRKDGVPFRSAWRQKPRN
jgi:hypothetical protein